MLPELFVERMREQLGEEGEEFLASFEKDRYQALRLNPLKRRMDGYTAAEVLASAEGTWIGLSEKVPWAQTGYYYDNSVQPGKHPYHEAGVYYIQEPSAMAPAGLLEACPGERILDLCAAPGGKSTQIAGAMQGEGLLICNEIHPARAKILSENIERLGIRNACVTNETPQRLGAFFAEYFDGILVDAPCSGEGMFRKNEMAQEEWSPENVERCAVRQDEILDCAAGMLRPGGRLVYSTCTFAVLENEGSIQRFLDRHSEFSQQETLRLWPHRIKGEGHFAAVLKKEGKPERAEKEKRCRKDKRIDAKDLEAVRQFAREALSSPAAAWIDRGDFLRFGDNLYLAPEGLPDFKGLKVLRPGLQLGTLKKNRFEPSHALALALNPQDAARVWNLSSQDAAVQDYLRGQTFPAEGEKGWYLVCVDGFGLGWGKLSGGMMKNHYPRGLRKN